VIASRAAEIPRREAVERHGCFRHGLSSQYGKTESGAGRQKSYPPSIRGIQRPAWPGEPIAHGSRQNRIRILFCHPYGLLSGRSSSTRAGPSHLRPGGRSRPPRRAGTAAGSNRTAQRLSARYRTSMPTMKSPGASPTGFARRGKTRVERSNASRGGGRRDAGPKITTPHLGIQSRNSLPRADAARQETNEAVLIRSFADRGYVRGLWPPAVAEGQARLLVRGVDGGRAISASAPPAPGCARRTRPVPVGSRRGGPA
jgi:hypothetical protein